MRSEGTAAYVFDRFVLDLDRGALLADGADRALRPKSFTLLRHFLENPGRLIDRHEIMQAVWPGVFVSDDSIAQCISDIRRALSDNQQNLLRTLPRRGYLFTAQVARGTEQPASGSPDATTENEQSITRPARAVDKPSIAVLPFQNMSGDPEQEYFADGMVEEIITALSRIRWLFVIARNSSFTYKGQAVDVKQVGRELGVRYVLEGSVRKAGGRVRITAQLIDAVTGAHLWADRFDGSLEDVFDLQDKVAISVAGVIEPALQAAETARSAAAPTERSDRLRPLSARAMRCSCHRRGKSPRRCACWSRRSRAIRVTGRRSPGRRSAVIGSSSDSRSRGSGSRPPEGHRFCPAGPEVAATTRHPGNAAFAWRISARISAR